METTAGSEFGEGAAPVHTGRATVSASHVGKQTQHDGEQD